MRSETDPSLFAILDSVSNGCCVIRESGEVVFWNHTLELWTGRNKAECVGANLFQIFPNLAQPRFRNRVLGVLQTGAPTFFSSALNPEFFPSRRPGGRARIQQTEVRRLPGSNFPPTDTGAGREAMGLITVSDVTDQHERGEKYRAARTQAVAEARLRGERETLYRLVVGLSSAAILICDRQGHILECNPTSCQLFDCEASEMGHRKLFELFAPHHGEALQTLLSPLSETEPAAPETSPEYECVRSNGETFPATLSLRFMEAGGRPQCIAYISDLTERKRTEEAMLWARKQESLSMLAGGIAHDFNNLLGGVLANLDLYEAKHEVSRTVRIGLDRVRGELTRAASLSQQMLAYSGKARFAMQPQSLVELLESCLPTLTPHLPSGIRLRCAFPDQLPCIEADAAQIHQMISYLINNAVEAISATAAPGIEAHGNIEISVKPQSLDTASVCQEFPGQGLSAGPFLELEIADSGCGIQPEHLSRIFDPFFTTKFAGCGLSLAVAQGILQAHRAGVSVASKPGLGTRFRIYFPIPPAPISTPQRPEHPQATPGPVQGRILVVDDEPVLRETVRDLLESLGHEVATAEDGREAVAYVEAHPKALALIIMDLTMPNMDGLEAFQHIRAIDPGLPIILSSGFTEHDVVQRLRDHGVSAFLPKPYRLSQLEAAISVFVRPAKT
ncbi:MAG TPA: response regulator [Holophaga sp.]|nr:response regulator [Holophaga sp.]